MMRNKDWSRLYPDHGIWPLPGRGGPLTYGTDSGFGPMPPIGSGPPVYGDERPVYGDRTGG